MFFFKSEPKEKIYVVDDEEDIRFIYKYLLNKMGRYEVVQFSNVAEIKDCLRGDKILPVLIISDIMMPGECGLTLKAFLKEYSMNIPLIHITALTGNGDPQCGYTILNKPLNINEFNEVIKRALATGKAA